MIDSDESLVELFKRAMNVADSITIANIQELLFIMGYSFSARDYITISDSENTSIYFDPSAATDCQIIFAPLKFVAAEAGPVTVDIYVNPVLDDTNKQVLTTVNRRATSSNVNKSILSIIPQADITNKGSKFSGRLIPSSSSAGNQANAGAESASGLPFEIDANNTYLIEIDNRNGAAALFEYNATWFENPIGG